MKKHFSNELVITEKDNKDFEKSTKCWACDNYYIDGDVEVRDHCHITDKYKGSALENIEAVHMDIVISMLFEITKFLLYFET